MAIAILYRHCTYLGVMVYFIIIDHKILGQTDREVQDRHDISRTVWCGYWEYPLLSQPWYASQNLSLNRSQYHWDILRISLNVPAMVRVPESQSSLVPIPLGHTENILKCPSYGKRARIPVLIGPSTIGTYWEYPWMSQLWQEGQNPSVYWS